MPVDVPNSGIFDEYNKKYAEAFDIFKNKSPGWESLLRKKIAKMRLMLNDESSPIEKHVIGVNTSRLESLIK